MTIHFIALVNSKTYTGKYCTEKRVNIPLHIHHHDVASSCYCYQDPKYPPGWLKLTRELGCVMRRYICQVFNLLLLFLQCLSLGSLAQSYPKLESGFILAYNPEIIRAIECEELTHWKRPWCWEGLGAGGKGDDRGWDVWMASPTRWTWVWVNSGSWWWTGRPGVLWFMESQRVGHNWTELRFPMWLGLTRRHGFDPWVGKIHWRRTRQPAPPAFLPGKGQRSLAGCCPCCQKELDTAEHTHHHF